MRVVQLLPELNEGGVERGVVELNRELTKRGIKSYVISNGGKMVDLVEKDGGVHIKFDVCSKNPLTVPFRVIELRKILQKIDPDIIHARSRVPAWLSFLANKKINKPFITTVHGFNSVNLYSKVMTFGDRVICVSNAVKNYVVENYNIEENKIRVIHRGVNLEEFNIENIDQKFLNEFKNRYYLNDKFIVTIVGRITPLKDFETFIKAIKLVKEKKDNVVGLIVGGVREDKKDYFNNLKELVKNLNLQGNIKFVGSQKKVAEIYYLSDIVVSSSKKPESFGRSIVEAMAMNTPVIATEHGGALDIIKEDFGELFKVGDYKELAKKIVSVKKSKDLREYVEQNFSLKQMVDKTINVYKELV